MNLKREILVWAEANSAVQGPDRTGPASLQRWLDARLPAFIAERDVEAWENVDGKKLALSASVNSRKRKANLPTTSFNHEQVSQHRMHTPGMQLQDSACFFY